MRATGIGAKPDEGDRNRSRIGEKTTTGTPELKQNERENKPIPYS